MMNEPAEPRHEESATAVRTRDVMSELDRETDQEILAILAAKSPRHVLDIARTADRHPITVDQTCARLYEQGHIYPVDCGIYDVTDGGKRRIGDGSES